jgi:hypothetical protein
MKNKRLQKREPGRELKAEAVANFMIVTPYGKAEGSETTTIVLYQGMALVFVATTSLTLGLP